jgi:DNA-binding NarL/FixJ family response regulator
MAQRLRPDAVVLDLVIPVVNGLDAARDIRCSVPETRLILFSGYAEELADFEMQSAGFAAQVSKDENIAALVQEMRGLFCSSAP